MNTNIRSVFALIAAFAAGALIFAPLQSFARAQSAGPTPGQIVFQPGVTNQFIFSNGESLSIYKIEKDAFQKKDKLTLVDKTFP